MIFHIDRDRNFRARFCLLTLRQKTLSHGRRYQMIFAVLWTRKFKINCFSTELIIFDNVLNIFSNFAHNSRIQRKIDCVTKSSWIHWFQCAKTNVGSEVHLSSKFMFFKIKVRSAKLRGVRVNLATWSALSYSPVDLQQFSKQRENIRANITAVIVKT